MIITTLLLLFLGTAWGSDSLQGPVWFSPQPMVSFTSWPKPMPFRALDVQDHSALIEVEVKSASAECKVPDDCFPAYQVERWRLPNLTREGFSKKPTKLGVLIAAHLAGTESFLFYRDHFVITDAALNVLERVSYPEDLRGQLDHGSPPIDVAAGGDFAIINSHLWDRKQGRWLVDDRWKLISPDIMMGDHRVMALGSYHSGEIWLIPYQDPSRAKRFAVRDFRRLFLSPDERRLLIEQRNGIHRLIDVENQSELQRWKQQMHYQQINWHHNRSLTFDRNGKWTLQQIEPHRIITHGTHNEDGFALVSEHQPVGIFFDPVNGTATLIHLADGRSLGQQKLPELADSYAWLGQDVPLAYSRRPLTLLLYSGSSERGIQQFRPYRLEMQTRSEG